MALRCDTCSTVNGLLLQSPPRFLHLTTKLPFLEQSSDNKPRIAWKDRNFHAIRTISLSRPHTSTGITIILFLESTQDTGRRQQRSVTPSLCYIQYSCVYVIQVVNVRVTRQTEEKYLEGCMQEKRP